MMSLCMCVRRPEFGEEKCSINSVALAWAYGVVLDRWYNLMYRL